MINETRNQNGLSSYLDREREECFFKLRVGGICSNKRKKKMKPTWQSPLYEAQRRGQEVFF
jgi:hypothetical protein